MGVSLSVCVCGGGGGEGVGGWEGVVCINSYCLLNDYAYGRMRI